jgi:pSer/pThr/pTyr-binding forkhead associated (FHA) protein
MQLILKPVSQPELGDIIVNDTLFAIGRHEDPFAGYDTRLVTRLSRRHARIFEQDGVVYLADLGSLNGTTVNGQSVDKIPVKLRPGDELCFAGLCYQAEILGAAAKHGAQAPVAAPLQLLLKPEDASGLLEPIVVSQFPFLVNKKSEVFARYSERLPDQLRYLSRRHAHIFVRNNSLYLEDLGSTNGTYVGGERLEEHARELHTGDVIAFGGDCFVYRAELVYADAGATADPTTHVATQMTGIEDVTRTTFVTAANSFLDIFCIEDAAAEQDQDDAVAPQEAPQAETATAEAGPVRGWRAPFSRLRTSLREARNALADDGEKRPRRRWLGGLVLITVAGAAAAVYISTAPQRNIRELLEAGEYRQATLAAGRYLERHGEERDVSALATEALLKATAPDWTAAVMDGDFAAAESTIEAGRGLAAFNPSAAQYLDIMQWVTGLEQFMVERGGQDAPLVMFAQEDRIEALLDWWEADPNAHHRSLATIAQQVPAFAELRARVFSHQRALQSHKALDLAAIQRLGATVEDKLQAGRAEDLLAVLADFETRYPRIDGAQKLTSDLDSYLSVEAYLADSDWLQAQRALQQADFQTPPFRARAAYISTRLLPPQSVMARYQEALQAWRDGELETAQTLLEQLAAARWGQPAQRQLERNRNIAADYARLQQAKGQAGYEEQLLAFYSELDPLEDRYFVAALKDEFELHREKALVRARQTFEAARAGWIEYRDQGGIRGLHRLEAGVSSSFRKLAATLSACYADISHATRLYGLLNASYPEEWNTLYRQITNEVGLQRRSLAELSMVLEPALKQAKLQLIPVLQSDQPERVLPESSNEKQ